ncbi:beta-propeller domain-containing protein [Saccharothrix longispora]|uniref:beta-propeller domain-containing protein n=1 Tax=Saccharothrix longispora TaxID=33920 RepID=UPI0028FD2096|nr:beta-propeller domain-containing protein [Saccharothrix longispora]MDU0289033.1 beta-propeller domain-containing protein [Saccharothrix longispora]
MRRWSWGTRAALVGGTALVVGVSAASAVPAPEVDWRIVPPIEAVPVDLVAYDSCENALHGLRAAVAPHVGVYGLEGGGHAVPAAGDTGVALDSRAGGTPPVAPQRSAGEKSAPGQSAPDPSAPEHSGTNTHERGVDEPDLVKTDGKRVVTVVDGRLRVLDAASTKVTGTLDLADAPASQLLLHGDRALLVGGAHARAEGSPDGGAPVGATPVGGASITLVDLSGEPEVLGTLRVDGRYVDARQVGDVVRVVVHSGPRLPWVYPVDGRGEAESLIGNREIAATAPIDAWLPRYELGDAGGRTSQGRLVACDRVSTPVGSSGASMLSVLTFDFPGDLGTGDAVTIVADGDTVYGTGTSLYVADDHHLRPQARSAPTEPPTTAIHQFDVSRPGPPEHVASGRVAGALLNQYSLSEHAGHLRVATTYGDSAVVTRRAAPATQSAVIVLRREGAELKEVGKVEGLGVGERIHSVRFVGPVGYVVTFRQVDPLYTLDLADPTRPRAVGELKITGYSAYLHPVGDGTLIGVGQEATTRGRTTGTQVSLFDVSDPAAPTRVAAHHLPGANSEVEYDPHAFLHWPDRDLVVLPVVTAPVEPEVGAPPNGTAGKPVAPPVGGVLVLRLADRAFSALGEIRHEAVSYDAGIRRALVIGDDLWTLSATGVRVTRIDGLVERAWVPFT